MIKALVFTNRFGRSLRCALDAPEQSGLAVVKVDGLVPGITNVNIHNIATIDGGYFGSARYGTRNIVAYFRFSEWNEQGEYVPIEQTRHVAYSFFQPKTQIRLLVETDTRSLVISGVVESCEPAIFESEETVQVSILCPGYYFKTFENGDENNEVGIYGHGLFKFPFCNNSLTKSLLRFGEIHQTEIYDLQYEGDAETGFRLEIGFNGDPVTGQITIANTPTGGGNDEDVGFEDQFSPRPSWRDDSLAEKFVRINIQSLASKLAGRYSGNIYDAGNKIVITTMPGSKSARFVLEDGTEYNILGYIDHIDWLKLYPGNNRFETMCNAASTGHFYVSLSFEALYTGV